MTLRKYAVCYANGNHAVVQATDVQMPGVADYLGDHINFWHTEADGTSTLLLALNPDVVDRIELVTPEMEQRARQLFDGIKSLAGFLRFAGPCPDPNCTKCKSPLAAARLAASQDNITPPVAEKLLDEADDILSEAMRDNRGEAAAAGETPPATEAGREYSQRFVLAAYSREAEKVASREDLTDGWQILSSPALLDGLTDAHIIVAEDWYMGRDGLSYDAFDNAVKAAVERGCTREDVDPSGATLQLN